MWIIGYLLALVIGGSSLGFGIWLLPTFMPGGLGFIAFGAATILATILVFFMKKPWAVGLRAGGSSSTGISVEVFVIFYALTDLEVVAVIVTYVLTIVATYVIGYMF
jgi:hypothetical protein